MTCILACDYTILTMVVQSAQVEAVLQVDRGVKTRPDLGLSFDTSEERFNM